MPEKNILIIDDEPDIRELLEITLGRMKLSTRSAADIASAKALLNSQHFDLCLTDMKLPDGNGISLVEHIQVSHPELPVAVITAFGSMDIAITALKAGAFDFISKPIDLESLRGIVLTALNLNTENPVAETIDSDLIGNSQAMHHLRHQISKLSRSQAPIFIHGESGSGKELAARAMHLQGPRTKAPFIAVNCGAIPGELMESEFFGHKKGSFTGAISDKEGLFQAAEGGTLFLDEVADLPVEMQVKLLRVIQEKMVRPVGSEQEYKTDVRILSASHKNLEEEVVANRFRQDLFFRINVIQLDVPALRERKEDILQLTELFLQNFADETGDAVAKLSEDATTTLISHDFPGNVRELENILERAYTLCENNLIQAHDLNLKKAAMVASQTPSATSSTTQNAHTTSDIEHAADTRDQQPSTTTTNLTKPPIHDGSPPSTTDLLGGFESLEIYLECIEKNILEQALQECRWNKTATAKRLGMSFRQLRYRLKKLGIDD